MAYTAALKPSILVTEVVVVPKFSVMVLELGVLAVHAIHTKSVNVLFGPQTSVLSDAIIVALTVLNTGILVCLVVEFLEPLQQSVYAGV